MGLVWGHIEFCRSAKGNTYALLVLLTNFSRAGLISVVNRYNSVLDPKHESN